ncbi:MAG: sulfotransferase [Pseudomonadota bacterium]
MSSSPVFIGGFRSGTTLLINLLGMHPDIAPWFETKEFSEALRYMRVLARPEATEFEQRYCVPPTPPGFTLPAVTERMQQLIRSTDARQNQTEASGKAAYEKYPIGNDCVSYSLADAEAALQHWQESAVGDFGAVARATGTLINTLGKLHCEHFGAPVWINKTPEISRFGNELRSALGACRIIYVVRDGMQVAVSGQKLGWGGIETLAFNWKGLLEQTREAMQAFPADYLEIRYESLIREPIATLNTVLEFSGRGKIGEAIISEFQQRFGAKAFDVKKLTEGPGLNPEERAAFMRVAGDMQQALGYQTN